MSDSAKFTVTDVIRSLTECPGLIRERTRVWFEESDSGGNSWWLELQFPFRPLSFNAKRRLEQYFETATRPAVKNNLFCYFSYYRLVDLDSRENECITVRVHIVSSRKLELSELRVLSDGLSSTSRRTQFMLGAIDLRRPEPVLPPAESPAADPIPA